MSNYNSTGKCAFWYGELHLAALSRRIMVPAQAWVAMQVWAIGNRTIRPCHLFSMTAQLAECKWSKFFSFMRVTTQLLKRLQRVIVVDGATHSQKHGVEGNGSSLKQRPMCCSCAALSWFWGLVFFFFFFWWGLLHGPQQGPDRKKEKKPIRLGKGKLLPKQKNPPWKTTVWENYWPTLGRAQAKSASEEQTEKSLTL